MWRADGHGARALSSKRVRQIKIAYCGLGTYEMKYCYGWIILRPTRIYFSDCCMLQIAVFELCKAKESYPQGGTLCSWLSLIADLQPYWFWDATLMALTVRWRLTSCVDSVTILTGHMLPLCILSCKQTPAHLCRLSPKLTLHQFNIWQCRGLNYYQLYFLPDSYWNLDTTTYLESTKMFHWFLSHTVLDMRSWKGMETVHTELCQWDS